MIGYICLSVIIFIVGLAMGCVIGENSEKDKQIQRLMSENQILDLRTQILQAKLNGEELDSDKLKCYINIDK